MLGGGSLRGLGVDENFWACMLFSYKVTLISICYQGQEFVDGCSGWESS